MMYGFSIGLMFFGALVLMVNPMIISFTVDSVFQGNPVKSNFFIEFLIHSAGGIEVVRQNLFVPALWVLGFATLYAVIVFVRDFFTANVSETFAMRVKNKLYDHLQKLPYNYHVGAQTGDLIQRCTSDVDTVRRFLHSQVIAICRAVFLLIFAIVIMLTVNFKMTLAAVCLVPFLFIFSYVFFQQVKKGFKASDEKEGEMSTVLQENVSGVRVVRAFGREPFEMNKFAKKNDEYRALHFHVIKMLAYYWSLSDILCFFQIGIVLVVGTYLTTSGEITLGQLIMFNAYVLQLVWPVRHLGRVLSDMGKMQVSLTRIYEILETPEETDTIGATAHSLKGDIVFEHVTFGYEEKKPILKDLSFHVKQGETIAVLGSTGSGKSTLMHILLRLYDYDNKTGSIRLNGQELRNIRKPHLREKIGMVLQEPFLYSKTIKDNLNMAKDIVEEQECIDATKIACVHDVIEGFEKGYETMVGERGVTLSGGQKQRVAIARTLIKNCDILIFDDSLSAVDTETDAQIRKALKEKSKDVTTFIISQRITTLMDADRIFVLENGKLSDSGTHEQLSQKPGLYQRIWKIQSMMEEDFCKEEGDCQ